MSKDSEQPTVTCVLGDEDVLIRFTENGIRRSFDYKISAPENRDATHLMQMEKIESDFPGAEKYQIHIVNEWDRKPLFDFTLYDMPGKNVVGDFYDNFCGVFAVCLVEQQTPHQQAVFEVLNVVKPRLN